MRKNGTTFADVTRQGRFASKDPPMSVPQRTALTEQDPAFPETIDAVVARLVRLSEESNAALMRGDIGRYQDLVSLSEDFTLMSPFGGRPSRGSDYTDERMAAMGRFFRNGDLKMRLVGAYASADLVVLALVERANVEVGGLPAQDWSLRVTLVYARDGADWRLAHRHADPLVAGVSLEEAAELAGRKAAWEF
jgi:ketosteroid isomerase-like protein